MIKTPEQIIKEGINGNINSDFAWAEFVTPQDKFPTLLILKNIKKVADILSIYKHKVFNGQPITITSGWRSLAHHKAIYAEINAKRAKLKQAPLPVPLKSWHLSGLAVDFVVKGFSIPQLFTLMDSVHFGGVERTDGNWQHIDLRNTICRFLGNGTVINSHYDLVKHNKVFH